MMRELKVVLALIVLFFLICCSPNPYDEGTESRRIESANAAAIQAAAQIPMMRELKVLS